MFLTQLKAFLRLSSVRQTLSLLAIFALITACAWGGTYWLVQREMMQAVDARLAINMQTAVRALKTTGTLPEPARGQIIRLSDKAERFSEGFQTIDPKIPNAPEFRYLAQITPYGQIILGENTERQEELRDILAGGIQVTLLGTLLATILAGLWMARRGQVRMSAISDGLAQVAKGHLDTRISLSGRCDDLSLLADRINTTTERLAQAMTQMRVQSSNIAHDLRTPLARLRAQIETSLLALSEHNRAITAQDLSAALEQIDHITDTFDALLRLARIESGAGRAGFAPLNLDNLAMQVKEIFGPVIEDAGHILQLEITDPAHILGDRDMLVQLTANLLQNALRYGPSGQVITLRIHGPRLSVSDQGPGIPFAEREKVLEPLYQGETSRQNTGFGLGLAMVRAICDLHEAKLSLSDGPNGQGLTATVQFTKFTEM